MKETIEFLIRTEKLKEKERRGWLIHKINNPETTAEHIFHLAFLVWILGRKKKINLERAVGMALVHDICEIYSPDFTSYDAAGIKKKAAGDFKLAPEKGRPELWQRKKLEKIKKKMEEKAMTKLLANLPAPIKKKINNLWHDYENGFTKEGRFVKQADKMANLLQGLEYWKEYGKIEYELWIRRAKEVIDDPVLIEFIKAIENRFFRYNHKSLDNEKILEFLIEIGQLKRLPRLYWKLRNVKKPETVAEHIFTLAIMALVFGGQKKQLNQEKLLKMALFHETTAIYTEDTIPFYNKLPKNKKERDKVFETFPKLLKKAKTSKFFKDYKQEASAIKKIVAGLEPALQKEFMNLWQEYRNRSGLEGRFLSQLNVMAILLRALLYKKEDKSFSVNAIWEWAFRICDDPFCCELMDELKRKFHASVR